MKKISYRKAAEEPASAYWTRWREDACASFGSPRQIAITSRPMATPVKPAAAMKSFLSAGFRRQSALEDAHAAA